MTTKFQENKKNGKMKRTDKYDNGFFLKIENGFKYPRMVFSSIWYYRFPHQSPVVFEEQGIRNMYPEGATITAGDRSPDKASVSRKVSLGKGKGSDPIRF